MRSRIGVSAISLLPSSARRRNLIAKAVAAVFRYEKARVRGEVNVIFVSRARMLALNEKFLKKSHDTDVIAFNYDQDLPGSPFGDIFISAFQARRQAELLGHPVLREVLTLTVHGALHLLGYDDGAPRQKALMFEKQDAVLAALLSR